MDTAARHIYKAIRCKTAGCGTVLPMHYGGPVGSPGLLLAIPTGWSFQCSRCRQTHRYLAAELFDLVLPTPPPTGFVSMFEGRPLSKSTDLKN